jgi:EF hand
MRSLVGLAAAQALLATVALTGCATAPMPSIGSINPFSSSKSISDVDRVFLMAAGSWDINHDNVVTCDEWKTYAGQLFDSADANHDSVLDASEWPRLVAIDRMFETANLQYFDQKGDGKVTRAEFIEKPNPAFTLMDAGKTCRLDGAQIASARSKTEYDVSGAKPQGGDPREQGGDLGKAANGGIGR